MIAMKRRRSVPQEPTFTMSPNMRQSLALFGLIWLSLSTITFSFQPASVSLRKDFFKGKDVRPFSEDFGPLYVAAATSATAPARLIQDWANKLSPVREKSKQSANVYSPSYSPKAADIQRRKEEWADRYTKVERLRETFGANRNFLWGDLDASTTRRLYKTLLPTSLMELVKVGVSAEELAPLAYEARVAAKMYARERSQVPARLFANLYDGFRQFRKYGKFQPCGMSYKQVWEKYEQSILAELDSENGLDEQDVTAKICLKILERSCATNECVDRWTLSDDHHDVQREDLARITKTLEDDVRKLLDPIASGEAPPKNLKTYRILRLVAKARRQAKLRKRLMKKEHDEPQLIHQ